MYRYNDGKFGEVHVDVHSLPGRPYKARAADQDRDGSSDHLDVKPSSRLPAVSPSFPQRPEFTNILKYILHVDHTVLLNNTVCFAQPVLRLYQSTSNMAVTLSRVRIQQCHLGAASLEALEDNA